MGKIFKFIFHLILILFIILLVAVGVLLFMLIDNSYSEPDYLKNSETVDFNMNDMIASGLENTTDNKRFDISLSEEDLSILLKSTVLKLNETLSIFDIEFKTAYVDVLDTGNVKFISYLSIAFLNSSIKGDIDYELSNNELVINMSDFGIGKISITNGLLNILNISESLNTLLIDSLNSNDLSASFVDGTFTIRMSLHRVKDLLLQQLSTTKDSSLYNALLSLIFRVDYLISEVDTPDKIGASINLEQLNFDNTTDLALPYSIDFDSAKDKVQILLNNGIISLSDADLVGTFLVKGYDKLSQTNKDKINNLDLSSIGIYDCSNWNGLILHNNKSITDVFIEQITELQSSFKLTEESWNNILLQNDIIGQMYCFVRKDNDYKVSYIAVESIYVDIKNNGFEFYITVSLNGESLIFNMVADEKETNGLKISLNIDKIRLGSVQLNNDEIYSILCYLENSIIEEWIVIDSNNKTIDIDFNSTFNSNPNISFILQIANVSAKFVDDVSEDYILIS